MIAVLATFFKTTNAQEYMKKVLDNKQQHMVAIAALEAKGDMKRLKDAINGGIDNGLTVNEIKEALSQLYAYTGFPRSLNALNMLKQVTEERKANGLETPEGKDADPMPHNYDALKAGTEVQTKLVGGTPYNYSFAPQTDFYLKSHLFGDIFSRNNLSHKERELVTVSALSALKGCEAQLKSHINGARNMGLSDDEIRSIPAALKAFAGDTEAWRMAKATAEVYGEVFNEGAPMEEIAFPVGQPNSAYAKFFTGNSWLAPLSGGKVPLANVTFEPRCRNNWHIHHKGGQVLICVGGQGWYQEWGKPARQLNPGDVVEIPAEAKHWHGASADSWFQHIAFSVPEKNASTEWLEPVTDEEYDKLK